MRLYILVILGMSVSSLCFGQINDNKRSADSRPPMTFAPSESDGLTPKGLSNYRTPGQKRIVVKGNITFVSEGVVPSPLETVIVELEARECEALEKKDTLELSRLWFRDFTLDQTQGTLVDGASGVPNYMSVGRLIEKMTIIDSNTVSTSGQEGSRQIKLGKVEDVQKPFFHTWRKTDGVWKLTTKG